MTAAVVSQSVDPHTDARVRTLNDDGNEPTRVAKRRRRERRGDDGDDGGWIDARALVDDDGE